MPLLLAIGFSAGCAVHRDLRLTEIGKNKVELYLDEPASNRLALSDHRLFVNASDNHASLLDLSVLGRPLAGGEFLVVWEDGTHTGAPEAADFPGGQAGAVPGIRVNPLFFHGFGDKEAGEVRIRGDHARGTVTDKVDDCVRFGDSAVRPRTGGTFAETGTLGMPHGSWDLQRRWDGATGRPIDTDNEADWVLQSSSWGVKTQ